MKLNFFLVPSNRIFRSKKIHCVLRQQINELLEKLSLVLHLNKGWILTLFCSSFLGTLVLLQDRHNWLLVFLYLLVLVRPYLNLSIIGKCMPSSLFVIWKKLLPLQATASFFGVCCPCNQWLGLPSVSLNWSPKSSIYGFTDCSRCLTFP